jgi:hypothetical protein
MPANAEMSVSFLNMPRHTALQLLPVTRSMLPSRRFHLNDMSCQYFNTAQILDALSGLDINILI